MKNILFRENQNYFHQIDEYLGYIQNYYTLIKEQNFQDAQKYRNLMAMEGDNIYKAFGIAGINSTIPYGNRALGYNERSIIFEIPFFVEEAFKSDSFGSISGNILPEIQDRYLIVLGKYKNNRFQSIINIINPFFWIRRLSNRILTPFIKLFKISSNNFIIKIINLLLEGIILLGAIRPILQELGYSQNIINFIEAIYT